MRVLCYISSKLYLLFHLEWVSNEVLLYCTGDYIQSLGVEHDGRQYEKKNVYKYMTRSLGCAAEIYIKL